MGGIPCGLCMQIGLYSCNYAFTRLICHFFADFLSGSKSQPSVSFSLPILILSDQLLFMRSFTFIQLRVLMATVCLAYFILAFADQTRSDSR